MYYAVQLPLHEPLRVRFATYLNAIILSWPPAACCTTYYVPGQYIHALLPGVPINRVDLSEFGSFGEYIGRSITN